MREQTGGALFTEIENDGRFSRIKKILLTSNLTQADTINAINLVKLDHFLERTSEKEVLVQVVKELLTAYIVKYEFKHERFESIIDPATLYRLLKAYNSPTTLGYLG